MEQVDAEPDAEYVPLFLKPSEEDIHRSYSRNGLMLFNSYYVPEEIMMHILSFLDPKQLLTYSLVCRRWNDIIKSPSFWSIIYERRYNRKGRDLPWYLYYCLFTTNYFTNMLGVETGQNMFKRWKFIIDTIEDYPATAKCVAQDTLDLHRSTGDTCILLIKTKLKPLMRRVICICPDKCYTEQWIFKLGTNKLIRHILNVYKPHFYFKGCGAIYGVQCGFVSYGDAFNGTVKDEFLERRISRKNMLPQQVYSIELTLTDYPNKILEGVIIENKHLEIAAGGTLEGAEVRFLFDSIRKPSEIVAETPDIAFYYKDKL